MKLKNLFTTLGLAAVLGVGVIAGLSNETQNEKVEAAEAGKITLYFDGVSGWSGVTVHFSLDDTAWYTANATTGDDTANGQFKYSITAESSTTLYCYFQQGAAYWHPENNYSEETRDTNKSKLDLSFALTAGKDYVVSYTGWQGETGNDKWFGYNVAELTEKVCLIKGTVASLSMTDDNVGQEIGTLSGTEFVITNLLLSTTDSFTFTVSAWGLDNGGYTILGDDACKALFDGTASPNLVPAEDGYYNFYVKATEIWVTKSDLIPAADGYYLRGSVLGWEGAPLALEGTGPYTVKREFAAGEKIQMIHLVSGLATYVPATTVNASDVTYFNAYKSDNDAIVENAGVYTVSITAAGVYSFTDTASAWCRDFLDSMTCTNSGQVAPQFKAGYSWNTTSASYSTTYNELDDFAKNAICGADAVANGTVIQEAVSRYDTIVTNHNYVKFITDSTSVLRSSYSAQLLRTSEGFDAMIVIAAISIAAIAGFGILLTIKRRKQIGK